MHALLVPHRADVGVLALRAFYHSSVTRPVGEPGRLDETMRHVDPKAVDAAVQPEPQHVFELLTYLRVIPVQIRLPAVKKVQVPLSVSRSARPRRSAEYALPVIGRQRAALAPPVTEHVTRPLRTPGCGLQRFLEPLVFVRGVI